MYLFFLLATWPFRWVVCPTPAPDGFPPGAPEQPHPPGYRETHLATGSNAEQVRRDFRKTFSYDFYRTFVCWDRVLFFQFSKCRSSIQLVSRVPLICPASKNT